LEGLPNMLSLRVLMGMGNNKTVTARVCIQQKETVTNHPVAFMQPISAKNRKHKG
jgi:hypothetical protein